MYIHFPPSSPPTCHGVLFLDEAQDSLDRRGKDACHVGASIAVSIAFNALLRGNGPRAAMGPGVLR